MFTPILIFSFSIHNQTNDSRVILDEKDDSPETIKEIKLAQISNSIFINDSAIGLNAHNWTWAKNTGICTGYGNFTHPYIIEDLIIDNQNTNSCIWIQDSIKHFIIKNCTLFNSANGTSFPFLHGGIKLNNASNGKIIDNNCSNNYRGLSLYNCKNITIKGNEVINNIYDGILLTDIDYTNILENTVNYNDIGLFLRGRNSTVFNNSFNSNKVYGIYSPGMGFGKDNHTFSYNTFTNDDTGIRLDYTINTTILGNNFHRHSAGIQLISSNYTIVINNTLWDCEYPILDDGNCVNNFFYNNPEFYTPLESHEDDKNNESKKDDSFFSVQMIALIILNGVVTAIITAFFFRKIRKVNLTKGMKIKSSSVDLLDSIIKKQNILAKFGLDAPVEDPMTTISVDFLEKVDQTEFTKKEKREFIKEMLSLSLEERKEILNNILKRLE